MITGILALSGGEDTIEIGAIPGIETLADKTPPDLADQSGSTELDPKISGDLADGKCRSAAARVRGLRMEYPDDQTLYVLEGGCYVCAGESKKALRSLAALQEQLQPNAVPPAGFYWFEAQAHLLAQDTSAALKALEATQNSDPVYRDRATLQTQEIMNMINQQ